MVIFILYTLSLNKIIFLKTCSGQTRFIQSKQYNTKMVQSVLNDAHFLKKIRNLGLTLELVLQSVMDANIMKQLNTEKPWFATTHLSSFSMIDHQQSLWLMTYQDKYGVTLQSGDIIDIHQTVNGQNLFFIDMLIPLSIKYCKIDRFYEYDKHDLLAPDLYGNVEWEIVKRTRHQPDIII